MIGIVRVCVGTDSERRKHSFIKIDVLYII